MYPGLAVFDALAEEAQSRGRPFRMMWIGSAKGMEREILESRGILFFGISSGKLRRYISIKNLGDIFRILRGLLSAYILMKRYRPSVLFSKGGYVSVPPVLAAKLAGVPVATHESDYDPGLATKINARFASRIFVSYEQTRRFFPDSVQDRIVVTGNPVRPDVFSGDPAAGKEHLDFSEEKPILLVLGGSQGAREVNQLVWRALTKLRIGWNVVHQTGKDKSGEPSGPGYRRFEYIGREYPDILAAAGLLLCRAGATTLWEIAAAGKPSLLLPLGSGASRGDQIRNAGLFEELGASYILRSGHEDAATELLGHTDIFLDKPELGEKLGARAASILKKDAAKRIAAELVKLGTG